MRKYFTLLVLLGFIGYSAIGQDNKAMLFFHDGDSIEGFAKIVKNTVKFKVSENSKADVWDHYSIKGLNLSNGIYDTRYDFIEIKKSSTPKLLELVESGNCYLYTKTKKRGQAKDLNKLVKNDGTVTINTDVLSKINFKGENAYEYYLKKKDTHNAICINCGVLGISDSWKKKAATFFSDCKVLQDKILKSEFSLDEMVDIVIFYNDFCVE